MRRLGLFSGQALQGLLRLPRSAERLERMSRRGKDKEYRIISNSTDYVEFIIDDYEYFRKDLKRQNPELSEQNITEILKYISFPFKGKFKISENGKNELLTDDKDRLIPDYSNIRR